jgi:tripartite-type tricarboxylate transporter receptor subunit TctC
MAATRRTLLFAGFLALLAATAATGAEYPTRPIRLIVPFTPGGGTDIIARALGQHLSAIWGQNVIIDNRPGGNTVVGSEIVARARPDGYTLIMQINNLTSLPAMTKGEQGAISVDQFAPVSLVAALPHVLVVHRNVPAASVKELVALAKASPGKLNYGTAGIGTPVHLAGAWFASMAGIDIVAVPYKGATEYTAAILGNHVQMVFGSVPTAMPHVKTGTLKALGVSTAKRVPHLPDIPTIAEFYPGYNIMSWYGVLAPAGTPKDIVDKLQKEISAATKSKKFADVLPDYELIGNTPAAFAEFIRKDAEVTARILAQSGAKAH